MPYIYYILTPIHDIESYLKVTTFVKVSENIHMDLFFLRGTAVIYFDFSVNKRIFHSFQLKYFR